MSDQNELKNMGLKATFPRLKILDVFRKADHRHQSAEDIYRALINDDVEIGLATVYRVLTQFEQAGILVRSQFVDGGKAVPAVDFQGHRACPLVHKIVQFDLRTGRDLVLQFAAGSAREIGVVITAAPVP